VKTAWSPPSLPTGSSSTSPTGTSGTTVNPTSNPTTSRVPASKPRHTGAIIGGVVGGVACIALVGLAYLLGWRRRRTTAKDDRDGGRADKPFLKPEFESPDLDFPPDFRPSVLELPAMERPGVGWGGAVPELQAEEAPRYHIRRKPVPELP
jgi:hypothetical protein